MVTIVVVTNIIISLILLYCAWQMHKLRQYAVRMKKFFNKCDRNSYAMLYRRPEAIYLGRESLRDLSRENQNLQVKIRLIKQILALVVFGRRVLWNRPGLNLASTTMKKK